MSSDQRRPASGCKVRITLIVRSNPSGLYSLLSTRRAFDQLRRYLAKAILYSECAKGGDIPCAVAWRCHPRGVTWRSEIGDSVERATIHEFPISTILGNSWASAVPWHMYKQQDRGPCCQERLDDLTRYGYLLACFSGTTEYRQGLTSIYPFTQPSI